MSSRSDAETAYFALLRAMEERDQLLAYREWLIAEQTRLDAFDAATEKSTDAIPARLRRQVAATSKPLAEAVGRRRSTVLAERGRIDDRIQAAGEFVTECETELDRLRQG